MQQADDIFGMKEWYIFIDFSLTNKYFRDSDDTE
jgi:hypothetical protein